MDNKSKGKGKGKGRDRPDMPQIGVRLTLDQLSDLDRISQASKGRFNRSDLIRRAVDRFLDDERRGRV